VSKLGASPWHNQTTLSTDLIHDVRDSTQQLEAACVRAYTHEKWNIFNPVHHVASLIEFILSPLKTLIGSHIEGIANFLKWPVFAILAYFVLVWLGFTTAEIKAVVTKLIDKYTK
jgi:hypothetical protein